MTRPAREADGLPQIDVDRAFAVLEWEVQEVLRDAAIRAPGGRLSADAGVRPVVRHHELVGWERGWTLFRTGDTVRCTVRALFAFPGRLWLVLDGLPILELRREELALLIRGLSPGLVERVVEVISSSLGAKPLARSGA